MCQGASACVGETGPKQSSPIRTKESNDTGGTSRPHLIASVKERVEERDGTVFNARMRSSS